MKMFGLAGIALSTSLVYMTAFLYLRLMLGRALKMRETASVGLGEPLISYGLGSVAENPAE